MFRRSNEKRKEKYSELNLVNTFRMEITRVGTLLVATIYL